MVQTCWLNLKKKTFTKCRPATAGGNGQQNKMVGLPNLASTSQSRLQPEQVAELGRGGRLHHGEGLSPNLLFFSFKFTLQHTESVKPILGTLGKGNNDDNDDDPCSASHYQLPHCLFLPPFLPSLPSFFLSSEVLTCSRH